VYDAGSRCNAASATVTVMDFSPSPRAAELAALVGAFVADDIEPRVADYHHDVAAAAAAGAWAESPILGELRAMARAKVCGTSSCRSDTTSPTRCSTAPTAARA